jgi:hypothetical protein
LKTRRQKKFCVAASQAIDKAESEEVAIENALSGTRWGPPKTCHELEVFHVDAVPADTRKQISWYLSVWEHCVAHRIGCHTLLWSADVVMEKSTLLRGGSRNLERGVLVVELQLVNSSCLGHTYPYRIDLTVRRPVCIQALAEVIDSDCVLQ